MTKTYTTEEKIKLINQTLPPLNKTVVQIAAETGIKTSTLYSWKRRYLKGATNSKTKERYSKAERFHFIVESASLNEHELAEYCRKKGIYPYELKKWKNEFLNVSSQGDSVKTELHKERQKAKSWKKNLNARRRL